MLALAAGAALVAIRFAPSSGPQRPATVDEGRDAGPSPTPDTAGPTGVPLASAAPLGVTLSGAVSPGITPSGTGPTPSASAATTPAVPGRANKSKVNLALGRNAVSSSDEGPGFAASAAVDGRADTRWSSGFADPQWIRVDLAAVWQVTDIRLSWEHAYATRYRVETSLDAKRWTTVYQTSSGTDGLRDIAIEPTPARYVRVFGTRRSSQYGYSLLELEVR